ncbi:MAG: hypothetical protein HY326_00970 [Chloroflexi bacterium]|nr:hypothetical protein [Chloroflexota bacterium]
MTDLLDPELAAYDLVPPVERFALPGVGSNNVTLEMHTGTGDYVRIGTKR